MRLPLGICAATPMWSVYRLVWGWPAIAVRGWMVSASMLTSSFRARSTVSVEQRIRVARVVRDGQQVLWLLA